MMVAAAIAAVLGSVPAARAQSGPQDRITEVHWVAPGGIPGLLRLRVFFLGNDLAGVWVGCSTIDRNGVVADLPSYQIENNYRQWVGPHDTFCNMENIGTGPWTVITSLWAKRVEGAACAERRNGVPCGSCQKNGFHLEGRLDDFRFRITDLGLVDGFFTGHGPSDWKIVRRP